MTDSTEYQLVTFSFKLYPNQKAFIEEAAEHSKSETILNASDFAREMLLSDAEVILSKKRPYAAPIVRGRGGSLVAQAAAKLGLSRQEFESRAAQHFAADTLGLTKTAEVIRKQTHESGTRRKVG